MNYKKIRDWVSLVAGFVLGQGAMFVAGVFLVARGQADTYGEATLVLGIISLTLWFLDFGSIPWSVSYLHLHPEKSREVFGLLWTARMPLSVIAIFAIIVLYLFNGSGGIPLISIICICFVFFLAPFGVAGILDANRLTFVSGIVSNFNWLGGAVALVLTDSMQFCIIFFMIGHSVATVIQLLVLRRHIKSYNFFNCTYKLKNAERKSYLRFGFNYILNYSSGQIYGRAVMMIVSFLLGYEQLGHYSLIKSIMNSCNQLITTLRRVEYMDLVRIAKLLHDDAAFYKNNFKMILSLSRIGILVSSGFVVISMIFSVFDVYKAFDEKLHFLFYDKTLTYFFIAAVMWSIYGLMSNIAVATNLMRLLLPVNYVTYPLGLVAIYILLPSHGLKIIAILEIILHIAQALFIHIGFLRIFGSVAQSRS
jgi:O-antigen/teichoic acid export membrane protein